MKIKTEVEIPNDIIVALVITAFEGGSNYWAPNVEFNGTRDGYDANPWYSAEKYTNYLAQADGLSTDVSERVLWFILFEDEDESGVMEDMKKHNIGRVQIEKGLNLMAANASWHFNNIVNDNWDAETADVFLQYVVLGEIVYG